MNQVQPDKTFPVLVGGAVLGVLSALPVINCGCCLWVIGGGMIASYLYLKNYPAGMPGATYADGAVLGLLAGVVGAVIDSLISIPVHFLTGGMMMQGAWRSEIEEALSDPEVPEGLRTLLESMLTGGMSIGIIFLGLVVSLVIFSIFGALGGILGIAIFKKPEPPVYPRQSYAPPPGPPDYPPPGPPSSSSEGSGEPPRGPGSDGSTRIE